MRNIVVVGSGFSGAIIARKIAEELDMKVTVVEKRSHTAGNMYDTIDEHGILIQKYGPHVLVTNDWSVIELISKYAKLYPYTVKELTVIDDKYVRLPYNFESVQQLIGPKKAESTIAKMRAYYSGRDRVPIKELLSSDDSDIKGFATLLFEKAYRTYCSKQWDVPIEKLDYTIMDRVPFVIGYDERYMNKDFQYLPSEGFTNLFSAILNHPNITVKLNENANEHIGLDNSTKNVTYDGSDVDVLVYTGAIDELFDCKYGTLPYRSLDIHYEWFNSNRIYPEAIISYPQAEGYTRKTEYKYLMHDSSNAIGTVIATEYPIAYVAGRDASPYYPVITDENKMRYEKYKSEAESYNIFLSGRLAEFRYYNMDDCIKHALTVFDDIKTYVKKGVSTDGSQRHHVKTKND